MNFINELFHIYQKLSEKENLKNLLFFLLLNLSFMFVEVLYGIISNSLGLLTDGAHMLLDCSAIIIGLYSSYLSDKSKNQHFNFGYSRSEVLGTFINAVFLYFIALYIVFESLERFINPKEIHSDHLILVSFLGLLINLVGVYYLHGSHSHGDHDHAHIHDHSHDEKKHNHKNKDKHDHKEHTDHNQHKSHKEKKCKGHAHEDIESGHDHSKESHGHSHSHSHDHGGIKILYVYNYINHRV
jgi:solute carrier family 30 (zinc transporter), member 5/7